MPVIFAKISGVKNKSTYWKNVQSFITKNTLVIDKIPFSTYKDHQYLDKYCEKFLLNGILQRKTIALHTEFKYGFLRKETLDYMFDKLQLLLDNKIIKGTFETGVEYYIVSIALSMPENIVRKIQDFDFTRDNPKIIYIYAGQQQISIEDAVILLYLHYIGFDILIFTPNGYQSIERYFTSMVIEEYQIGQYIYDMNVPTDIK